MTKKHFVSMQVIILVFVLILPGFVDAQSVSGSITRVNWPGGEVVGNGYMGSPTIEIENTGSEPHEFWVLIEVQDPYGKWYTFGRAHTDVIAPGKRDNFSGIQIRISPHDQKVPVGYYNGKVELYADFFLKDKLDSQTQRDAFEVDT